MDFDHLCSLGKSHKVAAKGCQLKWYGAHSDGCIRHCEARSEIRVIGRVVYTWLENNMCGSDPWGWVFSIAIHGADCANVYGCLTREHTRLLE